MLVSSGVRCHNERLTPKVPDVDAFMSYGPRAYLYLFNHRDFPKCPSSLEVSEAGTKIKYCILIPTSYNARRTVIL